MKVIHISDTHILEKSNIKLYGINPYEGLKNAVDRILDAHSDSELCLVTGDISENGSINSYKIIKKLFSKINIPAYFIPGNHDSRINLREVLLSKNNPSSIFLNQSIETSFGQLILLDTLDEGKSEGFLCESRLGWLANELTMHSEKNIILAMHHPPFHLEIPSMDKYCLKNGAAFWSIVNNHRKNVKHIFMGHMHRSIGGTFNEISFSCTRSTNHQVDLDFITESEVPGSLETPSYSVAIFKQNTTIIHHQDISSKKYGFFL